MSKNKLHETIPLSKYGEFDRMAVPGGWLYRVWDLRSDNENGTGYAALCFVPSARAPHVRDNRRLKLRAGCARVDDVLAPGERCWSPIKKHIDVTGWGAITQHLRIGGFRAHHADNSITEHATLLEAHDALIASGSESPFEVVTGPAVKAEEVKP